MKKTLIAALLLLVSASSFAVEIETLDDATNEEISELLNGFLPVGTNIGSCKITRSEPSKKIGSEDYLIDVENDNSKISLVVNNGGKATTIVSEESGTGTIIIEVSSEVTKKGVKTTQELRFQGTATEKDNNTQERILDLSIATKTQKTRGIFRSTKSNVLNCGSSTVITKN